MTTINKLLLKSMLNMGAVVEARDAYTGGHLWRVSQFSKLLAQKLGLTNDQVMQITLSGFLHDLGKVGVPDAILNKREILTKHEYAVIKTHPAIGSDLIREHPLAELAHDGIRHHHERIDGSGYPDQLAGESITLPARIISVADAFDAMTSTRPYRKGMAIDKAVQQLQKGAGSQFDQQLVNAFATLAQQGALQHIVLHSDEGVPMGHCMRCGPVVAVSRHHHDGDAVSCRVCGGSMRLHRHDNQFELEPIAPVSSAQLLRPAADLGPIEDLVSQTPERLKT